MSRLFIGSSICDVSRSGDLSLSDSFCIAITSRDSNEDLYVGLHEYMNCLVVYDEAMLRDRLERHERRRIAEGGIAPAAQLDRVRSDFGFAAPTRLDGKGRIAIAPWLHERSGEAHRVLIVGMGHSIEVWDLDHVLAHGNRDLRNLAIRHLEIINAKSANNKGDQYVFSLQSVRASGLHDDAGKSGLPFHPLHSL
jgi:DNA-binding transcriptional regulator/RsmH inhibitor MraZ